MINNLPIDYRCPFTTVSSIVIRRIDYLATVYMYNTTS